MYSVIKAGISVSGEATNRWKSTVVIECSIRIPRMFSKRSASPSPALLTAETNNRNELCSVPAKWETPAQHVSTNSSFFSHVANVFTNPPSSAGEAVSMSNDAPRGEIIRQSKKRSRREFRLSSAGRTARRCDSSNTGSFISHVARSWRENATAKKEESREMRAR